MEQVNPSDALGEEEIQALQSAQGATEGSQGLADQAPSWVKPFLSTEPRVSIGEIQAEQDCSRGQAHLFRGMMKAGGFDGTPAFLDGILGIVFISQEGNSGGATESAQRQQQATDDTPQDTPTGSRFLTPEELETGTRKT